MEDSTKNMVPAHFFLNVHPLPSCKSVFKCVAGLDLWNNYTDEDTDRHYIDRVFPSSKVAVVGPAESTICLTNQCSKID